MRWIAVPALLAWGLAAAALAGGLEYDAFSDRDGNIATEQHHQGAIALVHDRERLEAVYADAASGNVRAGRVWKELEDNFAGAGVEVAERSTRPGCLIPAYRELSQSCLPDWSFLDFLSKDRPGAAQLRKAIFTAFAARARERGLENQAILAAVNGLIATGVAAAALREAEVAASAQALREATPVLEAPGAATKGGGRAANKLRPDPSAEGAHSTFKRGPDGKTSNYATYEPNPGNPSGFQEAKRVDVTGRPHRNPDGTIVPTPHVKEAGTKGVRPAMPEELP